MTFFRAILAPAVAALLLHGALAQAAPFVPADDGTVVERLTVRWTAEARRQRAELARDPNRLPLALASAGSALQRARRFGDPRELGAAQAALAPWWSLADPPPAVRLLRATVLQAEHAFAPALQDLEHLLADGRAPLAVQAQAAWARVAVLQVVGRLADAREACAALAGPRFAALGAALALPAGACRAELASLTADPRAAAAQLGLLAQAAPNDRWLALLRAELAQRLGDAATADAAFALASAGEADLYAVAAHADWLLESARPAEALRLLQAHPGDADALLLRRAIAATRLGDARAAQWRDALTTRFEAARVRGAALHQREEARFALDVLGDAGRALSLARSNWAVQKEPADALLLARAARAAGHAAPLALLQGWVPDPAAIDRRLARLEPGAAR